MINLEQFAPADEIADALQAGKRSLAAIDRESIADSARSAARAVLPDDWFPPRRRRWPFVALGLLVASALAALFLFRRPILMQGSRLGSGPDVRVDPDAPQEIGMRGEMDHEALTPVMSSRDPDSLV